METVSTVLVITLALTLIAVLVSRSGSGNSEPVQLSEQARQLAADPARRSEAVEWCRRETGASKADALLAVELFVASVLPREVKEIAAEPGGKIKAIKLLRDQTGISLLAAKMAVENFMADQDSRIS